MAGLSLLVVVNTFAAGKKDLTTAVALVYGEQYRKAKASIMQPISECRRSMVRFWKALPVIVF